MVVLVIACQSNDVGAGSQQVVPKGDLEILFNFGHWLAASDETMMLDILLTNRSEVSGMLSRFQHRLAEIAHLLDEDDEARLLANISAAAQRRRRLFR